MKKIAVGMSLLILLLAVNNVSGEVRNHEAPGNLESKHNVACVRPDKIESKYAPPDLYRAVVKCADQDKYKEAVLLFALAGVYGRFDTYRVADKTAHQATRVLRMQTFGAMTENKKKALNDELNKTVHSPNSLKETCDTIKKIGPPNYYPRYMIQHGMGAFIKTEGSAIVSGFNSTAAWKESLETYLHCPSQ